MEYSHSLKKRFLTSTYRQSNFSFEWWLRNCAVHWQIGQPLKKRASFNVKRFLNTSLIIIVPSIASFKSVRVCRTKVITRCIRSISCLKKMFMEARAPIFCSRALTCTQTKNVKVFRLASHGKELKISLRYKHLSYLVWYVIIRKFIQHVICLSGNYTLTSLPRSSPWVFRLDAHDGVQNLFSCIALVSERQVKR